ncbi:hypothetical protein SpCBS45565_g02649 [Spizellomyces sp. 'palustris']|nr:hypothetical protein SpCBS45565_g02649 [Spizellomyces sp. 'palustris']
MSSKEEVLLWADGIDAYRKGDWTSSLEFFQRIGDYSRIHFNCGMIYTRVEDYASAAVCYTRALDADPYLAVAYFQRAYCWFMQEAYDRAERDYTTGLGLLRENDYIDYSQLGLKYRLYRCEIHFNRAMCAHSINDSVGCTQDISYAQRVSRTDEQKSIIDRAARVGVETVTLFTVPVDAVFEVGEAKVRNAGERSYLKDAKVVVDASGGSENGGWVGFDGAAIIDPGVAASDRLGDRNGTVVRRNDSTSRPRANTVPRYAPTPPPENERFPAARGATMRDRGGNSLRSASPRLPSDSRDIRYDGSPGERTNSLPRGITTNPSTLSRSTSSYQSQTPRNMLLRAATDRGPERDYPNTRTIERSYTDSVTSLPRQPQPLQPQPLQRVPYPSPSTSPNSLTPSSPATDVVKGKLKCKVHSVPPLSPRTVLLLVNPQTLTHQFLVSRVKEKFNLKGRPQLSFRDMDDDGQKNGSMISILDDDDLGVACEVMAGKVELYVSELKGVGEDEVYDMY